jgi:chromosome partitioning protein
MKILATYSIKGGVGKTAAAVNLAWLAAREGTPTLVWDLDPQAAASYYFRVKAKVKGGGKGLLRRKHALAERVKGTDFALLDLLPADFSYRHLDLLLDEKKKPTRQLRKLLRPLADEYECIILDCPPGITLASEAVFEAADALLVPVIPTTLSVRTLEQLLSFSARQDIAGLQILPFFSMADRRKAMHREIVAGLTRDYPLMLRAAIPYASEVERMGITRAPLGSYAPGSRPARAYAALWAELRARLDGPS